MAISSLEWNMAMTYLEQPSIRRVVTSEDILAYNVSVSGSLRDLDIFVEDKILCIKPHRSSAANFYLSDVSAASTGAQEIFGVLGEQGTWLHLPTASDPGTGDPNCRFVETDTPLLPGQPFQMEFCLSQPTANPDDFQVRLDFGGSYRLTVDRTGYSSLYYLRNGSNSLVAEKALLGPMFDKYLSIVVLPMAERTLILRAASAPAPTMRYCVDYPEAVSYSLGTFFTPIPADTVRVEIDGGPSSVRYQPMYFTGHDGTVVETTVSGPIIDLGRKVPREISGDYYSIEPPGTSVSAWLEDTTAALVSSSAQFVRPMVKLSSTQSASSPFVFDLGVSVDPDSSPYPGDSVDLSELWEAMTWERSRDELAVSVKVELVPGVTEAMLGGFMHRFAGFDYDGSSLWRAWLTPRFDWKSRYEKITLIGRGCLSRLETSMFTGDETFAGLNHVEAMRQLLKGAGLSEGVGFVLDEDADGPQLPDRRGASDDPTTPEAMTSRREYASYLSQSVGWCLKELGTGILWYTTRTGVYRGEWVLDGQLNNNINRWILGESWSEELKIDEFRNEIWFLAEDSSENALMVNWVNEASQNDPTAADYVAERRIGFYVDPAIKSEAALLDMLDIAVAEVGTIKRIAVFQSYFDNTVAIFDTMLARGYLWTIIGMSYIATGPNVHCLVTYTLERDA